MSFRPKRKVGCGLHAPHCAIDALVAEIPAMVGE
jgi:hypothetical protein